VFPFSQSGNCWLFFASLKNRQKKSIGAGVVFDQRAFAFHFGFSWKNTLAPQNLLDARLSSAARNSA
jgi:hypothetical protein